MLKRRTRVKSSKELQQLLNQLDGKSYGAYKEVKGMYHFNRFMLALDHIQGDPYAAPSRARILMKTSEAGFKKELIDTKDKQVATADFIIRNFEEKIKQLYTGVKGSGKSGLIYISHCGQEMLQRSAAIIDENQLEVRIEIGLPAAGRRILGKAASHLLVEVLPKIVEQALIYKNVNGKAIEAQVALMVDQQALRKLLVTHNLVAFIENGAILPRESGVSDKPLLRQSVPFQSPKSLEIELDLPNRGKIKGMGLPKGITLIVGGGYHGKSTLLNALEKGVYNHILGDGREFVITNSDAVKIRAEDGRSVKKVNISSFINHLPNGKDTLAFSTDNASGSTSQAANVMEALEVGSKLLLIDEDTSATNFMIRDYRMQQLVAKEKEPITPFVQKVKQLYKEKDVSTILVVGGSGDYFEVADHVIMMDEYKPVDVTKQAKDIAQSERKCDAEGETNFGEMTPRIPLAKGWDREAKVKTRNISLISYGKTDIDLSGLEQLVSEEQTQCIGMMLQFASEHLFKEGKTVEQVADALYTIIKEKGLEVISPYKGHPGNIALPRKYEFCGALSRYRELNIR